nr:RHS repeat-associated core domain-containing protein [Ramlibacter albus]
MLGEYGNGSATGKGRTEYIWLPTENGGAVPVGVYLNGKLYSVHTDHLGTARLITDASKNVVWQWPYSAHGGNRPTGVLATSTTANGQVSLQATKPGVESSLAFPGQLRDPETGTFYNFQRDSYDPFLMRYRQSDPIGIHGGWNRYIYAGGDPLLYADPRGLDNPRMGPYGPYYGSMGFRPKVPSDSCTCMLGSTTFYAPTGTNFAAVQAAGQSNGRNPLEVNRTVGHWGTFDFQRDVAMNQFTAAYTDASNFAVGVYMHGAGYSREATGAIAGAFARAFSSNAGSPRQRQMWMMGWDAANSGNLQYACQ